MDESPEARIAFLTDFVPRSSSDEEAATLLLSDAHSAAQTRECLVEQLSLFDDPQVFVLDLAGIALTPLAVRELILPLAQRVRGGEYGTVRLVICTTDPGVADFIRYMAQVHQLPLYLSHSPSELRESVPVGDLTKTESSTLDTIIMLGGQVTASKLAACEGIGHSAATNRLVKLDREGYLFRHSRSRREGDIYIEPRSLTATPLESRAPSEVTETGTGRLVQPTLAAE